MALGWQRYGLFAQTRLRGIITSKLCLLTQGRYHGAGHSPHSLTHAFLGFFSTEEEAARISTTNSLVQPKLF